MQPVNEGGIIGMAEIYRRDACVPSLSGGPTAVLFPIRLLVLLRPGAGWLLRRSRALRAQPSSLMARLNRVC